MTRRHLEVGIRSRSFDGSIVGGHLTRELLAQGREFLPEARDGSRVVRSSRQRLLERLDLRLKFALLLEVVGMQPLDLGILVGQFLRRRLEPCVQIALLPKQSVELALRNCRLVGFGLERANAPVDFGVLRHPGLEFLVERAHLGLKLAVLAVATLEGLRELDDLVLEFVGDLLEVRRGSGLGPERLELLASLPLSDATLYEDNVSAVETVRTANEAAGDREPD